ncbi:hypothetical protein [Sphingobacterium spiritivorum]
MKKKISKTIAVTDNASSVSQTIPLSRPRSASSFTQVDDFLSVIRSLGIPTADSDILEGQTDSSNAVKIIYNTTLHKLRIYNPANEQWRDAVGVDLSDYYTQAQTDAIAEAVKDYASNRDNHTGLQPASSISGLEESLEEKESTTNRKTDLTNPDNNTYPTTQAVSAAIQHISLTPGPKGDKGDKGDTGTQGQVGPKGDTGPQGIQGIQGVQGPKGEKGETGLRGIQGEQGIQGVMGDPGTKGDKGDPGLQGLQGLKGDKGDKGNDGTSVTILGSLPNESSLPPAGNRGDAYLIEGFLYVWNGSAWEDVGNIKGPKGDKGEQGIQGVQGTQGVKGDAGERGPIGMTGSQGIQGSQGVKGEKGDKGDQGEQGVQGPAGDPASNIVRSVNSKIGDISLSTEDIVGLNDNLNSKANKDGANTSGTWPINVSGNADRTAKIIDYVNGSNIYLGWNGTKGTYKVDNTDFGINWPINVIGSANQWNGANRHNTVIGNGYNIEGLYAKLPGNLNTYPVNAVGLREFLGSPLGGETLGSIINRSGVIGLDKYIHAGSSSSTGYAFGWSTGFNGFNFSKSGVQDGVLFLSDNTNVGVGTTTPEYKLHVNGEFASYGADFGSRIRLFGTPTNPATRRWFIQPNLNQWGDLGFFSQNNDGTGDRYDMLIHQNGNVGIGTLTPRYKLDVNGNIKGSELGISYSDGNSYQGIRKSPDGLGTDYWSDVTGSPAAHLHRFTGLTGVLATIKGDGSLNVSKTINSFGGQFQSVAAYYKTRSTGHEGVKIRLPVEMSSDDMISFKVRIYAGYIYRELLFSGYLYKDISNWYAPKVDMISGESPVLIVMGKDDNQIPYVWIQGDSYASVAVVDVMHGYTQMEIPTTEWSISRTNSDLPNQALNTTIFPKVTSGDALLGTTNAEQPKNFNLAIGYDDIRNFIQSHNGKYLDINPLGNGVRIQGAEISAGLINNWNQTFSDRVTLTTNQQIIGRKIFSGGSGNAYNTSTIEIQGDGSANKYPTIGFHQPGINGTTLSVRHDGKMYFNDDRLFSADRTGSISNGSDGRENSVWFDYNYAEKAAAGSVISFSGLNGAYATELFGQYNGGGNNFYLRTRNGDAAEYNPARRVWTDGDFMMSYNNSTAWTVVQRNGSGYIEANYIRTAESAQNPRGDNAIISLYGNSGTNGYHYSWTSEAVRNFLGLKTDAEYVNNSTSQSIGGSKIFTQPVTGADATADTHLVTKRQVSALAAQGSGMLRMVHAPVSGIFSTISGQQYLRIAYTSNEWSYTIPAGTFTGGPGKLEIEFFCEYISSSPTSTETAELYLEFSQPGNSILIPVASYRPSQKGTASKNTCRFLATSRDSGGLFYAGSVNTGVNDSYKVVTPQSISGIDFRQSVTIKLWQSGTSIPGYYLSILPLTIQVADLTEILPP